MSETNNSKESTLRADAVNLASHIVSSLYTGSYGADVTEAGVATLARAVLEMDASIRFANQSAEPHGIPETHNPAFLREIEREAIREGMERAARICDAMWKEIVCPEECASAIRAAAMCPTPHFAPQPISPQGGNGPLVHTNNPLSEGYGRYSERKALGCPTCDGVDATSCLRCYGKTRLFDWILCDTGFEHRPPNATSECSTSE